VREESACEDDAVVEVVNDIENKAHNGDGVMLGKRGRSQRALWQWWVQKGGILRETRSLERQTMLGGRDRWEGWSLSRYWLTFPLRLKTQLSVDKTKSRHCLINVEKGKRSGCWKIDWGLRQWEKTKKCLMLRWLCYEVGRRFKEKVSSEWKKSSGGFTAYQRCDLSVIFAKTTVMSITLPSIHWLTWNQDIE